MPPLRLPWRCIPNSAFGDLLIVPCDSTYPASSCLRRLLASRSRWAGYLQSLPSQQNWDGIALFWGAVLHDRLSSPQHTSGDGRARSRGLDLDSDAVEARRWLNGTEAEGHLFLPGPPRTPLLVGPSAGPIPELLW